MATFLQGLRHVFARLSSGRVGTTPSKAKVESTRPTDFGAVEPEVAGPPPRSAAWCDQSGNLLQGRSLSPLLVQGRAVRGWIVSKLVIPDHEGPDYVIYYAFEEQGRVHVRQRVLGYDTLHWAYGQPESFSWFGEHIEPGNPVTVLVDRQATDIFGLLDPYLLDGGKVRWTAA